MSGTRDNEYFRDTLNIERVLSDPVRLRITLTNENGVTLGRDLSVEEADEFFRRGIAMTGLRPNPVRC